MVDKERGAYRPRRAYIESEPGATDDAAAPSSPPTPQPRTPQKPGSDPPEPEKPESRTPDSDPPGSETQDSKAPDSKEADSKKAGSKKADSKKAEPEQPAAGRRSGAVDSTRAPEHDDDEQPKPLYREERRAPAPATPPANEDTGSRTFTFVQRPPQRTIDDEATTVLPRTTRRASARSESSDVDDEDEHQPLSQRSKLILLIGAVAAVVVIGLAIGYAVIGVGNQPSAGPSSSPSGGGTEPGNNTTTPPDNGSAVLTEDLMLSAAQAKGLDSGRSWKITLTQRGQSEDAPVAACFSRTPAEGEPTPQQRLLQVLSSDGKNAPGVLHDASAYNTPEEAAQAFAVAAKTLGGCQVPGSYLVAGRVVSDLGDQAAGVIVNVVDGSKTQAHSVILSRTGRVLNVLDATKPTDPLSISNVAKTLGVVSGLQCKAAGGSCASSPSLKNGPPPLGGDEPGFLTYGDLPPAGPKVAPWVATAVELPKDDFVGSGCESVNWATVAAQSRSSRVYLVQDSGNNLFGLNEIVLTLKDEAAAKKLVDKVRSDLTTCAKRKLTATVSKPAKVQSVGARNTAVSGWTAAVAQKSSDGTLNFRVGIVSAGAKVAFTFLTPDGDFNFSNAQWNTVAVRAGERTTQVS